MYVIIGKTASGKDAVVRRLAERYGFKKVVTYTTRPPRDGEKDGVTYHFVSQDEFVRKLKAGFFLETKSYPSVAGNWYYGTAREDLTGKGSEKSVVILTPEGYNDVCARITPRPRCVYLYADTDTITKRLRARGDMPAEAERRIKSDAHLFRNAHSLADRIVYNNDGANIDEVVVEIARLFADWEKEGGKKNA